ncbi:hypothetical protein [Aeromonas salmonicida]|uniref:hypothetical protein n=1 Tax=Aeromonas salmonicida TaxID=645 RepID=UPI0039A638FA
MKHTQHCADERKLGAQDVYSRLGEALGNVLAATKELKKDKFKFNGGELSGPKKCTKQAA